MNFFSSKIKNKKLVQKLVLLLKKEQKRATIRGVKMFYKKQKEQKEKLYSSIKLRMTIITFFFIGGLLGGILYSTLKLYVLSIAAIVLIIGIVYDQLKLRLMMQNRNQNID